MRSDSIIKTIIEISPGLATYMFNYFLVAETDFKLMNQIKRVINAFFSSFM